MADDKTKRGSPDNKRLNKGEPYEVAYARKKAKAGGGGSGRAAASARARPPRRPATRSGGVRAAAAPAARKKGGEGGGARHASSAERRKDDREHRAADDEGGRRGRPPDRRPPAGVGAVQAIREARQEEGAQPSSDATLAATICDMLKAHTTIEEEIFYPAARKARIEASLLDEADIEHASAKDLIAQIEFGNPADDHYDAKVKVLGEYITHHVVEEHTEMFPKCRRGGIDLVALRGRMEARKAELESDAPAKSVDNPPMAASAETPGILSRISDSLLSGKHP